ncbi:MAG: hypothetical protein V2A77_09385, partial [Pseudomonadota bacterium]
WWEPQNIEFWVSVIPVVFLLAGGALEGRPRLGYVAALLVGCLFVVNLFGSVLPQTSRDNDYWYSFNSWFIHNCDGRDLVVTGTGYLSNSYITYYSGARTFSLFGDPGTMERRLGNLIASPRPRRILFSSTLQTPSPELVRRYHLGNEPKRLFMTRRGSLRLLHSDRWQDVYEVGRQGRRPNAGTQEPRRRPGRPRGCRKKPVAVGNGAVVPGRPLSSR